MLWLSAAHGLDLATPERRAGLGAEPARRRGDDPRRRRPPPLRDGDSRARRAAIRRRRRPPSARPCQGRGAASLPASAAVRRQPTGPSASLLANRWSASGRGGRRSEPRRGDPARRDRPSPGNRRRSGWNPWRRRILPARRSSALAAALISALGRITAYPRARAEGTLDRAGHGEALAAVLEKLGQGGLGWLSKPIPSVLPRSGTMLPTCVFARARYLSSVRLPPQRSPRVRRGQLEPPAGYPGAGSAQPSSRTSVTRRRGR